MTDKVVTNSSLRKELNKLEGRIAVQRKKELKVELDKFEGRIAVQRKKELEIELNNFEIRLAAKIDDRIGEALRTNNEMLLEAVSGVMDEKLSKLKGEFFNKIDPLFKESKDSSEERTILASRVANHEDRISKLEQNSLTN